MNGKYSKISGSFVQGNELNFATNIRIYVDGKLVFEKIGVTKTTGKINFTLDVKNASAIKICVSNDERQYFDTNHIALVDVELTK